MLTSADTPRICPICRNSRCSFLTQILIASKKVGIALCPQCEHRWLCADLTLHAEIEGIYDNSYIGFRRDPVFESTLLREFQNRIAPLVPKSAKVLDVGCGNGAFLKIATESGYSVRGIDVSQESVDICVDRGLSARVVDFVTGDFGERFGLITMWDVVEHLHEPGSFIARASELLSEKGILVLKIPHYGSLNFEFLKITPSLAGVLLGAPGHVQYFSKRSLETLLLKSGFKTINWFPQVRFRSRPTADSLKRFIGQSIQDLMYLLANNTNLYLAAARD